MITQKESPYDSSVEAFKTENLSNQKIPDNYSYVKSPRPTPLVLVSTQEAHRLMVGMTAESARREVIAPAPIQLEANTDDNETPSNYHLPQVWADYLNKFNPWSWYGHFTFRDYPHPETACKTFDLFIHKLNRHLFGCRYYKHPEKGVTWARGTEYQRRGAVHFHAILGRIPEDVRRLSYMDIWYKLGGISRIHSYEAGRGAEYYMSKSTYAWKKGEIDLGGPLSQAVLTL